MSKVRILSAARAVLEKEGAASLTVRKVAGRAGLSPMAMYRHFQNKDALLNALMDDGLAAWEDIARGIRVADPLKWLAALGEAFLEFALREPHRFDAAFFLPAPQARQYPNDFVAGRSPVVAMAMVRVDQARSEGLLGDKPALDMVLTMATMGQGFISMYRANRFSDEKQFRTLFRAGIRHCIDSFKPNSFKPGGEKR